MLRVVATTRGGLDPLLDRNDATWLLLAYGYWDQTSRTNITLATTDSSERVRPGDVV